jgi:fermentation-respiration switch protein FrsA (DUF1100 family)
MHGERDPWITGAETTAILDRLQGPKQLLDFPGLGHEMPFVYGAPDLWVKTVGQFLARLPPV